MQELKLIHSIRPLNYTWSRINPALIKLDFGGRLISQLVNNSARQIMFHVGAKILLNRSLPI
jgi:hypothetical protein